MSILNSLSEVPMAEHSIDTTRAPNASDRHPVLPDAERLRKASNTEIQEKIDKSCKLLSVAKSFKHQCRLREAKRILENAVALLDTILLISDEYSEDNNISVSRMQHRLSYELCDVLVTEGCIDSAYQESQRYPDTRMFHPVWYLCRGRDLMANSCDQQQALATLRTCQRINDVHEDSTVSILIFNQLVELIASASRRSEGVFSASLQGDDYSPLLIRLIPVELSDITQTIDEFLASRDEATATTEAKVTSRGGESDVGGEIQNPVQALEKAKKPKKKSQKDRKNRKKKLFDIKSAGSTDDNMAEKSASHELTENISSGNVPSIIDDIRDTNSNLTDTESRSLSSNSRSIDYSLSDCSLPSSPASTICSASTCFFSDSENDLILDTHQIISSRDLEKTFCLPLNATLKSEVKSMTTTAFDPFRTLAASSKRLQAHVLLQRHAHDPFYSTKLWRKSQTSDNWADWSDSE